MFYAIALLWVLQDPASQIQAARQAYVKQAYPDAIAQLTPVVETAAKDPADLPVLIESSRLLASVYREMGDPGKAADVLNRAATLVANTDPVDIRLAAIFDDLSAAQRAQDAMVLAITTIQNAIHIREAHPEAPRAELARDITAAAMMQYQRFGANDAIFALQRAVREWDA